MSSSIAVEEDVTEAKNFRELNVPLPQKRQIEHAPRTVRPQPGPQETALNSSADIVFYGGAAGGGKTWALLLEILRWIGLVGFTAVVFRRTSPEIMMPGGLWDKAQDLFPWSKGVGMRSSTRWDWPSGAWCKFSHMQHEDDMYAWQGGELALLCFDELTHFTERMFWYLVSRMRSTCGVNPYCRATCNPLANSWVAKMIEWWIDEDGFAITERSGVIRYFARSKEEETQEDKLVWGATREELTEQGFADDDIMSFTFVAAKLSDNPALLQKDPKYLSKLRNLPRYERLCLLDGNWHVERGGGMRFQKEWFKIVEPEHVPHGRTVRYWDRAGTDEIPVGAQIKGKKKTNDPDHTAGVKIRKGIDGYYYVLDVVDFAGRPAKVLEGITNTASQDESPGETELWMEQDPASAGKGERHYMSKELSAYGPRWIAPTGSKWKRSGALSAAAENGLVRVVRGPWNGKFLAQLHAFVDEETVETETGYHDDMVDGASGAYNRLQTASVGSVT